MLLTLSIMIFKVDPKKDFLISLRHPYDNSNCMVRNKVNYLMYDILINTKHICMDDIMVLILNGDSAYVAHA